MTRALIVGKFYPPHIGHLALIEFALSKYDFATVLIYGSPFDSFSVSDRVESIRESISNLGIEQSRIQLHGGHDITPFNLDDPRVWDSHAYIFKTSMNKFGPIDALVSSEPYGTELARRLDINSVEFDVNRANNTISATEWRLNPIKNWDKLAIGTQKILTTRAVFLGAESTGTSTTALEVTKALKQRGGCWSFTNLVLEYGREVTLQKLSVQPTNGISVDWQHEDFVSIGERQSKIQEQAVDGASPVVICDTDAFATTVWEKRYLGEERSIDLDFVRTGDVYLLTDHAGVPFVQDGTRDGEHIRQEMTGWFASALEETGRPWAFLTGSVAERVDLAIKTIDKILSQHLQFTDTI